MTELLIVSKPRGRIFKWIGGGIYKTYKDPVSFSASDSYLNIDASEDSHIAGWAHNPIYQKFKTRGTAFQMRKVSLKVVNPDGYSGSATVKLYSHDSENDRPGSELATIGTIDFSGIGSTTWVDVTPTSPINIEPNKYYWIGLTDTPSSSPYPRWVISTDDIYADGFAYCPNCGVLAGDFGLRVYYNFKKDISLDFIYSGTATKRLEASFGSSTGLSKILVNGQDMGTDLLKTESIPQADNYTIGFRAIDQDSWNISGSIQRYLYYNKTSITLDDLDVSEAYLQEVEYGADGGILRVDDSPDSDLVGSSNEKIQFTDILVPFRKLEWISGGGEVLILGVE